MPAADLPVQVEACLAGEACAGVLVEAGAVGVACNAVSVDTPILGDVAGLVEFAGQGALIQKSVVETARAFPSREVILVAIHADGYARTLAEVCPRLAQTVRTHVLADS